MDELRFFSARRSFFWQWKPSFRLIPFGVIAYLPGLQIRIGHYTPPCRECGKRSTVYSWPGDNPGATICHECCKHEDYEYDRCERDYLCTECSAPAPYEWGAFHDDNS